MKKQYKTIANIRATPEGYTLWLPKEAFSMADQMPEDTWQPPSKEGGK